MKSVFIFLFSIVYLQTLAQAVPDYSFAAFGFSNDVVKSEEITYEYSDLDNKYIEYEKIVLTFQNGLLTEKVDDYSGLYASTTKTNYTYLNGKISKEMFNQEELLFFLATLYGDC